MPGARMLATAAALAAMLGWSAPPAAASGDGSVLVVGDSIELLTIPYLQRHLLGVRLTTNAVGGYNSNQIYELFAESYEPSHSVIVFDAGTNDNPAYPQILAANLTRVTERIGDRCMVVPTIHGLTVDGIGNDGKNSVVRSFAASRPGTQAPDWAGAVAARPELLQADDLHPAPAGADHRAQLIARGVEACLAFARGLATAPRLERAPRLAPARRFAHRGAALAREIATSLATAVVRQLAGEQALLAAALTMASTDA